MQNNTAIHAPSFCTVFSEMSDQHVHKIGVFHFRDHTGVPLCLLHASEIPLHAPLSPHWFNKTCSSCGFSEDCYMHLPPAPLNLPQEQAMVHVLGWGIDLTKTRWRFILCPYYKQTHKEHHVSMRYNKAYKIMIFFCPCIWLMEWTWAFAWRREHSHP